MSSGRLYLRNSFELGSHDFFFFFSQIGEGHWEPLLEFKWIIWNDQVKVPNKVSDPHSATSGQVDNTRCTSQEDTTQKLTFTLITGVFLDSQIVRSNVRAAATLTGHAIVIC